MKPRLRHSILRRRSSFWTRATSICTVVGVVWVIYRALHDPDTPIPRGWNPVVPLHVADAVTPLTGWKLERAVATPSACFAALEDAADFTVMADLNASDTCHIKGRLELTDVAETEMTPFQTRCALALRKAMWITHGLQPAARAEFNADLAAVDHIGSYTCRQIRSDEGKATHWSNHATADAIDIAGFKLSDGTQIRLIDDWGDSAAKGRFLQSARDSACRWFRVTLSPDFDDVHADHFHLQSVGWGLCR